MIGLDTNLLVRYITQDHLAQSRRASRLIEQRCTLDSPCYIAHVVLCELVWVLDRAYGYDKRDIVAVLEQILVTSGFEVENGALAWNALQAWKAGPADFSDYLLVLGNQAAGCEATFSFDRRLARQPAAKLP